MTKIKAIIFDMGGVVNIDIMPAVYKRVSSAFHMNAAKIQPVMHKYFVDLQKDYISTLGFWHRVCKELDAHVSDSVLSKLYSQPYEEHSYLKKSMIDLIQKLKINYKIGLITNTINDHYQVALARGHYNIFDVAIISTIVKLRKPEKEIYLLALQKLQVKPEDAIYIDDYKKMLAPADELGMKTVLFTSVGQLKHELRLLGVVF
jgi:epoxide hydrolase-like predicted phosphatase